MKSIAERFDFERAYCVSCHHPIAVVEPPPSPFRLCADGRIEGASRIDPRCQRCVLASIPRSYRRDKQGNWYDDLSKVRYLLRGVSNATVECLTGLSNATFGAPGDGQAFHVTMFGFFSRQPVSASEAGFPVLSILDSEQSFEVAFMAPLIRVGLPDCLAFWETTVFPNGDKRFVIELHRSAEATKRQLVTMVDGLSIIHTLRMGPGGRRRDDSDIEGAIRAIAAGGKEPTPKRVATFLYDNANRSTDPYDSLYKRLAGRDGQSFSRVFANIKRRALG